MGRTKIVQTSCGHLPHYALGLCRSCYGKDWFHKHPRTNRRQEALLRRYGLTDGMFKAQLATQNGVCAICGQHRKRWHVDHAHDTNRVRGILCAMCNSALGRVEREGWLDKALEYIGER